MSNQPPKWIDYILEWYCHPAFLDEIKGDLYECFYDWKKRNSLFRTHLLYALNTLLFLRIYNSRFSQFSINIKAPMMLGHFLKVSYRNFKKHLNYNITNLTGLTVGIAISLIMILHIKQELSYEKSYPKHDRIVRITMDKDWAKSSPSFAAHLQNYYPDLELTGRFARSMGDVVILSYEERKFISNNIFQADPSTLNIFDFEFIQGNPKGALERPNTAIITEKVSNNLYGVESPIGKTIQANGDTKYEITGVINDLPKNSHLKSDMFISMATFYENRPTDWLESKSWMVMYTYALMRKPSDLIRIDQKLDDFRRSYRSDLAEEDLSPEDRHEIMKLTDIHLHSNKIQEMGQNSSITYVYIFGALAVIIMVIASVNFINIFTTLALKRVKEVGLRKIIGAHRRQLIIQLLSESIFTTLFATILGVGLCILTLPFYNSIIDLSISYQNVLQLENVITLLTIAFLLGLVAGFYPASLVTKESMSAVLSRSKDPQSRVSFLRKGLIVFQFMLSLFILISSVAINQQMDFIQSKDAGYNAERVASVKIYGELYDKLQENRKSILDQIMSTQGVTYAGMSSDLIGEPLSVEGFALVNRESDDEWMGVNMLWTDENYLKTMGINLKEGRNFMAKTDTSVAYLVNEKLVAQMGKNPIGEMAEFRDSKGPVVGIVKDFHYYSLHQTIEPMVICYRPSWASKLLIKMESGQIAETMAKVENKIADISPSTLFFYDLLDDKINELYKGENAMFKVFKVFSFLALLISCVGLLGLAAIEVQSRTKEVGIRKALGASSIQLLQLISMQFIYMILIAIIIGIPIAYFSVNQWLTNFSYQVELGYWVYIIPSLILIILSLLVVAGHVTGTIKANPVKSLRYE